MLEQSYLEIQLVYKRYGIVFKFTVFGYLKDTTNRYEELKMSEENKVYVGNLPYSAKEDELKAHFAGCGDITDCIVIIDRDSKRSKGFGFVTFSDAEGMKNAINLTDKLDDRELRVSEAQQRKPRDNDRGRGGY